MPDLELCFNGPARAQETQPGGRLDQGTIPRAATPPK